MSNISASAFSDTKAHYELLDGLRGVAAFMVIWYHVFEGLGTEGHHRDVIPWDCNCGV